MPENEKTDAEVAEGIDPEAAHSDDEEKEEEAEEEPKAEASDEEATEESSDEEGDDDDGLGGDDGLDLMDIFAEEEAGDEGGVGKLADFLEELSMDQVSGEADRLLEEFRAI